METLIKAVRDAGFFSFSETLCDSEKCNETRHVIAQKWAKGKGYGGRSLWCVQLGDTYVIGLWSGQYHLSKDLAIIERSVLTFLTEGDNSYQLPEKVLQENRLVRDDDFIGRYHGRCVPLITDDDDDE